MPPVSRWLPTATALLAVALLLGGTGIGMWKLASIPVGRVAVSGDLKRVSQPELMAVITQSLSGGFLWIDLDSIREPLEALPWVYRAVVRRRWPDSIEVEVVEQTAIARWGDAGLLNHAGEVFMPGTAAMDELPRLSGPAGSHHDLMREYRRIQAQLQGQGMRVAALHMNARGGLEAELGDGVKLVFGRGELDSKLARLRAVLAATAGTERGRPQQVDLRYSHGLAIAWQPPANQDS
ncbi:MAG: cell division protein FtsQ/DivIB [Halieaceae bacterium]|nr:cell division protein FtsQ/DivIB [Halieaceae bacterium]